MTILLSFPKCASDWIRYVLEYVFRRPTVDEDGIPKEKFNTILRTIGAPGEVVMAPDPLLTKIHDARRIPGRHDRLILSLRDCEEVVFSYGFARQKSHASLREFVAARAVHLDPLFRWWMRNVIHYDRHAGPKHLVRYEQLGASPAPVLSELCAFLGLDAEAKPRLAQLLSELPAHARNCIDYKRHPGARLWNTTYGQGQRYTRDMLTAAQRHHIHAVLKSCDERLARKYAAWEQGNLPGGPQA